jgi:O-acetyl-ADP-ribose deacetylase (regulator of RNase III)
VIHAVGPRFQEERLEAKLRATVMNVMRLVVEHGIRRVAFPAMGAGFYGVPLVLSAQVSVSAVHSFLEDTRLVEEVVFCLRDRREYEAYRDEIATIVRPAVAAAVKPSIALEETT